MAKKISQLPVKTNLQANDIFVFVDDAFTDDNETSYVTYDTLKTQLNQSMGVSETTSASWDQNTDTLTFLRSNGTTYAVQLTHEAFQFDSVRLTGGNAPANGSSLRWNNASISASEALTTNPVQVRTATDHPFANGDLVNFTNFTNMFELNNSDFYIKTVNSTAFDLYTDSALTVQLNGLAFSGNTNARELTDDEVASAVEWLVPRFEKWGWPKDLSTVTTHRDISPGRKDDIDSKAEAKLRSALKAALNK